MAKSEETEYNALCDLEQIQNKNEVLLKELDKVKIPTFLNETRIN